MARIRIKKKSHDEINGTPLIDKFINGCLKIIASISRLFKSGEYNNDIIKNQEKKIPS